METNTVILSLPEYNALRDFKTNLEMGNSYQFVSGTVYSSYGAVIVPVRTFVSPDEAIKEAAKINETLSKSLDDARQQINDLKTLPQTKEITVEEIKKMSIREFLKWRNK